LNGAILVKGSSLSSCHCSLVENAVQYGVQSSPKAGHLRLVIVRRVGEWWDMSISDDGQGVPATEVERVFFAVRPRVHALSLLPRRLQALFGRSFRLEVCCEVEQGTTVTLHIPLRTGFEVAGTSLESATSTPFNWRPASPKISRAKALVRFSRCRLGLVPLQEMQQSVCCGPMCLWKLFCGLSIGFLHFALVRAW
jgi:hypothetical protein